MTLISPQVQQQLAQRFATLDRQVVVTLHVRSAGASRLVLVGGTAAGGTSDQVREIVENVIEAADGKVRAEVVEVPLGNEDQDLPRLTIGLDGEDDPRVEFRGLPSGYEFATLIDAIERTSTGRHLSPASSEKLAALETPVEVMVFVTPTCQYCPAAASTANRMALASDKVRSVTVEANEFPHLAQRFGVQGVPLTVVNGSASFVGALPEQAFVERVLELAAPAPND